MKQLITLCFILISFWAQAQEEFTLEKCYALVNTNFPLVKQKELFNKKSALDASVIKKGQLPTLDLGGQASYQSDVTHVPISNPSFSIEPPNKDQYKATLSANQLIYNGGFISKSLGSKNNELKTEQKQLEVTIYGLKKQVNQLYFSILLLQEKKKLLEKNKVLLEKKLKEINAGVEYGALLPSAKNVLTIEVLKVVQRITEVEQNKNSLLMNLSQLIGQEIAINTILQNPSINVEVSNDIKRPELELFQMQKQQFEISEQLLSNKNAPKLFGFATTGYGNPGLNMLDNTFQTYYLVGLKFNWNIFDWNINQKQRMSIAINKEIIDNQQEVFKLNTNIELSQQQSEIDKIRSLIETDKTIIELQKKIVTAADAQLINGTITPSAYAQEITALFESENNLSSHQILLLLAKANYNTIIGN